MNADKPPITRVGSVIAESGECPVWSVAEKKLYWIDQGIPTLNRLDPLTGVNEAWLMPAHIGSFALRPGAGRVLVALRNGLFLFDASSGSLELAAAPTYPVESQRYNDGRCDRQGRFCVGSVDLDFMRTRTQGAAKVYRFDATGLSTMIEGITVSNGMAFSPDGRTLYVADSPRNCVYTFDYEPQTGHASNQRLFVKLRRDVEGLPDGAEMDAEGGYWIALLNGSAIARYLPDGTLDRRIEIPALQPTKVAFGGPHLSTLYITTASHRYIPGDKPLGEHAGGILAVEVGVRGIAEPLYAF